MIGRRSLTLIGLLVTVIIIGILAGLFVPMYLNAQKKIHENEAKTNLKLIQAAEKTYRIEKRGYIETVDTLTTNQILDVDLPAGGYWEYSVPVDYIDNSPAVGSPQSFCAEAIHGEGERLGVWHIRSGDIEATEGSCGD